MLEKEDPGRTFVIPVVVDDLPFARSNVPLAFKQLHFALLPEGAVDPGFVNVVRQVIRAIKRK